MSKQYTYSELTTDRLYETLELVRDVFMEFEAPDYSEEGIEEFLRFLEPDEIAEKLDDDNLRIWICEYGEEIVGMISGMESHINLLFVSGKHHRKGIARTLLKMMTDNYKPGEMTVNSSPYALEAYRRLGFIETDTEQEISGIRYTPMKKICDSVANGHTHFIL